jgi:hypothetical protein
MKVKILCAIAVLTLSACGSMNIGKGPIGDQKLSTNFVSEKIKIETKCSWFGMGSDCNIVAIESIGTDPSYGGTVTNRKNALTRAEMRAKSNVAMFLNDSITTERVQTTIAKNIEKASDKVRSGNDDGQPVEMTDREAKNVSLRENDNHTAVTLTETIRTSASAILRGFTKVKEEVIGNQEVAVTVRWDLQSNNSRKQLQMLMR